MPKKIVAPALDSEGSAQEEGVRSQVDILVPPMFEPSGEIKPVWQAVADGNWLGAINLWIVRPGPALIYQERRHGELTKAGTPSWAPGKLDGSVAGYYQAGESGLDGLREAKEELGRDYSKSEVTSIGRRLNIGVDSQGRERRAVISIYMTYDSMPLSGFRLHPEEVPAIYEVPLTSLVALFSNPEEKVVVKGVDSRGKACRRTITAADFTYMWDGYHAKIARLARRYAKGERALEY